MLIRGLTALHAFDSADSSPGSLLMWIVILASTVVLLLLNMVFTLDNEMLVPFDGVKTETVSMVSTSDFCSEYPILCFHWYVNVV